MYEKPVRLLMRDMVADLNIGVGDVIERETILDWFQKRYPLVKRGTVQAHLIRMSTNAKSRLHHNLQGSSDDLFFQLGTSRYRLFDQLHDPKPITSNQIATESETEVDTVIVEEGVEYAGSSEFAYEHDLRDYLAKNLHLLEPGLKLFQEEGITGIEFPAGRRFIDILAVDGEGNYVVIELKVSKGYDRVIGQLLYYIGWIEKKHAEPGKAVRGIIVAKTITDDLTLACSRVPDVHLYQYSLSVSVHRVNG